MKKIIYITIAIFLVSCSDPEVTGKANSNNEVFDVINIDGCEYISRNLSLQSGVLTHKGDCSNRIHMCPCDTTKNK